MEKRGRAGKDKGRALSGDHTSMHRKEDEKPSEEFWEHFFREENFQGVSGLDEDSFVFYIALVQ